MIERGTSCFIPIFLIDLTSLCVFPTCEDNDDENSEDVRVIGQDPWGVHRHVELAEFADVSAYQPVERGAPRSGHARSSCGKTTT